MYFLSVQNRPKRVLFRLVWFMSWLLVITPLTIDMGNGGPASAEHSLLRKAHLVCSTETTTSAQLKLLTGEGNIILILKKSC